jgi:hypothetical protein
MFCRKWQINTNADEAVDKSEGIDFRELPTVPFDSTSNIGQQTTAWWIWSVVIYCYNSHFLSDW